MVRRRVFIVSCCCRLRFRVSYFKDCNTHKVTVLKCTAFVVAIHVRPPKYSCVTLPTLWVEIFHEAEIVASDSGSYGQINTDINKMSFLIKGTVFYIQCDTLLQKIVLAALTISRPRVKNTRSKWRSRELLRRVWSTEAVSRYCKCKNVGVVPWCLRLSNAARELSDSCLEPEGCRPCNLAMLPLHVWFEVLTVIRMWM
jgi:hypothetical protein